MAPQDAGGDDLTRSLAAAGRLLIDGTLSDETLRRVGQFHGSPARPLTALLSTWTVLRRPVAAGLAQWALRHGMIGAEDGAGLQIVLQESVTNAAIHGNCRLPGLEGFGDSYEAFAEAIDRRLDHPDIAGLPVIVSFRRLNLLTVLHVDDCGPGHAPRSPGPAAPSPPDRPPAPPSSSGRGFLLMRSFSSSLHLSRGGRRLSAGFSHV